MLQKNLAILSVGLFSLLPYGLIAQNSPLIKVDTTQLEASLGWDDQIWGSWGQKGDRQALLKAIDHSLDYINTTKAAQAYQNYPISGITRDRVRRSLIRFRQLVVSSRTPEELQNAVQKEFIWYQSKGNDNLETVAFTGYFEPIYQASRKQTAEYRYPLYRKPTNFGRWEKPHPTRSDLEGNDGLKGAKSPLAGYELVWLKDRLEAYLVQVQGSAKLRLSDGKMMGIGFDGNTDYPYTSIGKELIKDGVFSPDGLTLPMVIEYLRSSPEKLDIYLPRNNRFIFFKETFGKPATGSIGVPVTAERSIATDKSILPPGALAVIQTTIPVVTEKGKIETREVSRYVLDQDTGSAIKGALRVDIFMGTGKIAGDRAGLINNTGKLYYLLLK
ncbi:murein transglycosylase [Aphanothece hegewaldii CCALA 016]|uniref:peptidoglycan lytic exotransglycosylase n=1 Tax=Aphanothece hegewaldii CCALA 016 TaxID=2107694 RepID=A0A2T1M390_9CHRO|nr:murein transglycosylase A [Aphanothece hegewaldii]PSF39220.1 murein transglycosylase [Aphanothece hegewaldii CCALA 016]